MTYKLSIQKKAIKALEEIDEPYYSKIKSAIYSLLDNPRPPGCKKLRGRDGYRIRVGDYRVIYDVIDMQLIIEIINLGHRKDIYE